MKKNINLPGLISIVLLIFFIGGLSSCNTYIEKRRYRKGYHVSHIGKTQSGTIHPAQSGQTINTVNNEVVALPHESQVNLAHRSVNNVQHRSTKHQTKTTRNQKLKNKPSFIDAGACDILFLKDGTSIEILVASVNEKTLLYKKCNNPDGPSYEISMSKVESIEYKNGEIYRPVINKEEPTVDTKPNGRMITSLVFAIISLICVIVSFVLLAVFGGGIPFGYGIIAAIPLFITGPFSLAGLIMSGKYTRKGNHPLGKVAFYLNIIAQILAIIALIICFIPF